MKTRIALCLLIAFRAATACDCYVATVEQAEKSADVIFRGTITKIQKGTVYFEVARAWKGPVAKVFTMPEFRETSFCIGFWPNHLRVGADLLLYAKWYASTSKKDGAYFTNICTRTQFAKDAGEDFSQLGPGSPPPEVPQRHFLFWALFGFVVFGIIGGWSFSRRLSRRSVAGGPV